jgi:E3 ubiquitin-protein ligase UBR4
MLIKQKSMYCLDHHRSIDVATCIRDELQLLSETCALSDDFWESRLRLVFELLFSSVKVGARHPVIAEHIILPCLRIISQVCTPPKAEEAAPESDNTPVRQKSQSGTEGNDDVASTMSNKNSTIISKGPLSVEKGSEEEYQGIDVPLVSYEEWKHGATYVDFVRRQYIASQVAKPPSQKVRRDPKRADFLALKYFLRWKRAVCKRSVRSELSAFEDSSWVRELALSACSPAIRIEMCGLIEVLCSQSAARRSIFLNLLMTLLPSTRTAGEGASEYFELLFKMVEPEDARLFLTVRGFLQTLCRVITEEVSHIESQEHTFHVDISQGYILHKLIELLGKFLQVPNIRIRYGPMVSFYSYSFIV